MKPAHGWGLVIFMWAAGGGNMTHQTMASVLLIWYQILTDNKMWIFDNMAELLAFNYSVLVGFFCRADWFDSMALNLSVLV